MASSAVSARSGGRFIVEMESDKGIIRFTGMSAKDAASLRNAIEATGKPLIDKGEGEYVCLLRAGDRTNDRMIEIMQAVTAILYPPPKKIVGGLGGPK